MIEVEDYHFADDLSDKTGVIDFYAQWCGPCRAILPILKELEDKGISIYKINIDEQEILSSKFRVNSIPYCVFIKNGQVVDEIVGAVSRDRFLQAADKLS